MPRRKQGPLQQLVVRLELGPELGPNFERLAAQNARSLSAEVLVAVRSWVHQHSTQEAVQ
jgi:hypothetical protein